MQDHYSINIAHYIGSDQFGPQYRHYAKIMLGSDEDYAKEQLEWFRGLYASANFPVRAKLSLSHHVYRSTTVAEVVL